MRKIDFLFIGVVCFIIGFQRLNAQWSIDQISATEGLSQNTIKSILQDSNGFIWIGTYYGINKYDGYSMKYFKFSDKENSLSGNQIHSLFEDKDGYIWAATPDAGINRINQSTGKIDTYFNSKVTAAYFRDVNKLHQAQSGAIFYNTNNGLRLFKISERGELKIDTLITNFNKKNDLRQIITGKTNKHWVLSQDGNLKLKELQIEEHNDKLLVKENPTGLDRPNFTKGRVTNFFEFPKNTFWFVSTKLEMLKITLDDNYNLIEEKFVNLVSNDYNQAKRIKKDIFIDVDKNDRLWIAGEKLLLQYDTHSGEILNLSDNKNYQVKHQKILNILVDQANLLWIGTYYNGLYKIDLESVAFLNSNDFVSVPEKQSKRFHKYPITVMAEDKKGDIWLGGLENGGLAKLKGSQLSKSLKEPSNHTWNLEYFNSPLINNIRRLYIDTQDKIWIGSLTGLNVVKNSSSDNFEIASVDELVSKKRAVFSIEEDHNGSMWIGYWGEGLVKLNKNSNYFDVEEYQYNPENEFSLSNNFVRDILEDSHKNIWVGTVSGLNRIKSTTKDKPKFERFLKDDQDKNSLSNNHILDIFQSKSGKIYVGTFGGGLNEIEVLDNDELKFEHYKIQQGLPSNVVYQIAEDIEGNIWMMHIREISKLDIQTGKISYYDRHNGFQISEFKDNSMLKTSSGMFLFGGVNGFTFFNPENLSSNKSEPNIVITDFKLFDETITAGTKVKNTLILEKDINETDKITLPHDLNFLEFHFSSLHYSNPNKNQYKYILEGFEENWQFSTGNTHRFATYTNVPPGEYVFKVFGSNSSGVWGSSKELKIQINSPWYKTPFAIIFLMLFGLLIIYISIRIRLTQINLRNQLQLEGAIHEKSLEINRMKLQFFTNISHELRTPLTLILGPLQQIMQGNIKKDELTKLNSIIFKNSNRLLKLINQLLDFRKAESGNLKLVVQKGELVSFIKGVSHAFEEIANKKNIKFIFLVEEEFIEAWFDSDKVEKILYNLLSNAFKYTPNGKTIILSLKQELAENSNMAIINVTDYGIGISKQDLESIFEQFYQAKKHDDISEGSGLGLAYVKHLVEIHKATIDIKSKLHHGTTFVVRIPIQENSYDPESIVAIKSNIYDYKYTRVGVQTISDGIVPLELKEQQKSIHSEEVPQLLIVEDNTELRNYLTNYFSHYYRVIPASNGKEGLELAKLNSPDAIISDLMMPLMGGLEMCKKIKNSIETSHIHVMILTAKAGIENEKEGLETGADEFILKPFDIEVLKLRVDNILKTRKLWIDKFKTEKKSDSWKELKNKLDQKFLEKAISVVNNNIDNYEFSVEKFTVEIGMSRSALFKKLKSVTGHSTTEFIRTIRMKKALNLLASEDYTITEVIFLVGFSDPKYFRTCFKKQFGKTPSEYRKAIRQIH